jgi:hypothetical protein
MVSNYPIFLLLYSTETLSFFSAFMSSPAHIQLIVEEKQEDVAKATEEKTLRLSRKQVAQGRGKTVKVGGDV